jgi:hypothetical protein
MAAPPKSRICDTTHKNGGIVYHYQCLLTMLFDPLIAERNQANRRVVDRERFEDSGTKALVRAEKF